VSRFPLFFDASDRGSFFLLVVPHFFHVMSFIIHSPSLVLLSFSACFFIVTILGIYGRLKRSIPFTSNKAKNHDIQVYTRMNWLVGWLS